MPLLRSPWKQPGSRGRSRVLSSPCIFAHLRRRRCWSTVQPWPMLCCFLISHCYQPRKRFQALPVVHEHILISVFVGDEFVLRSVEWTVAGMCCRRLSPYPHTQSPRKYLVQKCPDRQVFGIKVPWSTVCAACAGDSRQRGHALWVVKTQHDVVVVVLRWIAPEITIEIFPSLIDSECFILCARMAYDLCLLPSMALHYFRCVDIEHICVVRVSERLVWHHCFLSILITFGINLQSQWMSTFSPISTQRTRAESTMLV